MESQVSYLYLQEYANGSRHKSVHLRTWSRRLFEKLTVVHVNGEIHIL